jgi:predicted acyltransferase
MIKEIEKVLFMIMITGVCADGGNRESIQHAPFLGLAPSPLSKPSLRFCV